MGGSPRWSVINEPALKPHGQETLLLIFTPVAERLLTERSSAST